MYKPSNASSTMGLFKAEDPLDEEDNVRKLRRNATKCGLDGIDSFNGMDICKSIAASLCVNNLLITVSLIENKRARLFNWLFDNLKYSSSFSVRMKLPQSIRTGTLEKVTRCLLVGGAPR